MVYHTLTLAVVAAASRCDEVHDEVHAVVDDAEVVVVVVDDDDDAVVVNHDADVDVLHVVVVADVDSVDGARRDCRYD